MRFPRCVRLSAAGDEARERGGEQEGRSHENSSGASIQFDQCAVGTMFRRAQFAKLTNLRATSSTSTTPPP